MEVLGSLTLNYIRSPSRPSRPPRPTTPTPSLSGKRACCGCSSSLTSRRSAVLVPAAGVASLLFARCNFFAARPASAQQEQMADELQQEEDRLVKIFQVPLPVQKRTDFSFPRHSRFFGCLSCRDSALYALYMVLIATNI